MTRVKIDNQLPIEVLDRLIRYEPETGKLFWKERPVEFFKPGNTGSEAVARNWNGQWAGKEAFTANLSDDNGYKVGAIFAKPMLAHRVAWALHTGAWPEAEIDHRNGVKNDNRFENLRDATHAQNNMNKPLQSNSTSKLKGVSWHKTAKKWRAYVNLSGKQHHLGLFVTRAGAYAAYCKAAEQLHEEFARTG